MDPGAVPGASTNLQRSWLRCAGAKQVRHAW